MKPKFPLKAIKRHQQKKSPLELLFSKLEIASGDPPLTSQKIPQAPRKKYPKLKRSQTSHGFSKPLIAGALKSRYTPLTIITRKKHENKTKGPSLQKQSEEHSPKIS